MRIICIIPARGGSKGVPRKNIRRVKGIPLVVHSIKQALAAPSIDAVYVSTDDVGIARVAIMAGAQFVRRPPEISGDEATSESALRHTLDSVGGADVVVFLQATSPIRKAGEIERAIDYFLEQDYDSMFSASPIEGFAWLERDLVPMYDYQNRPRRQDFKNKLIEENGSIYIFKSWVLEKYDNRLGGRVGYWLQDRLAGLQVDSYKDLEQIERIDFT